MSRTLYYHGFAPGKDLQIPFGCLILAAVCRSQHQHQWVHLTLKREEKWIVLIHLGLVSFEALLGRRYC